MTLSGVPNLCTSARSGTMGTSGNGLPVEASERLERIVIELVGIAAQPGMDRDLRNELMQLAYQISLLFEK